MFIYTDTKELERPLFDIFNTIPTQLKTYSPSGYCKYKLSSVNALPLDTRTIPDDLVPALTMKDYLKQGVKPYKLDPAFRDLKETRNSGAGLALKILGMEQSPH